LLDFPSVETQLDLDLEPLISQGYYGYQAPVPHPPYHLYREILTLLNRLTDLTWFPFDTFLSLLNHGRWGDFLFPVNLVDDLYRRLSWYSWDGTHQEKKVGLEQNLQKLETQAVLQLLDSLVWLGVIVLGYRGRARAPQLLRLSPPAHAALTHQPYEEPPTQPGQIIVQPDFQVLALGPVAIATLIRIEEIAKREKIQPAAVSYRITRDSVYPALQSGQTVRDILGFLEEVTGQPVPQNVSRTLQEWGSQHERIVIRQDVLIFQTDTSEMLDDLLEDSELKNWLHQVDDRTAWVHSDDAHRVEKRLEALEILPAFSRGPEADLPKSLCWEEEQLRSRHALPSLYVTGTVRRIAEERDEGWALTPESVRGAVTAGLEAPEIVSLLERMTGAPLPEVWEKRLKAWSGHYGEAQTAHVRLLRVESPKVLRELRKSDRRLSRWLCPLEKGEGLAVVRDDKWEQVVELLEEWGVVITESKWW
ncbi:MAG: helicase-associated domain-containing protein, partial [Anaerolineae bacterium]